MIVLVDEVSEILSPDWTVQRADVADLIQNTGGLFEQKLNMRTVFSDDVGKISAGIVNPVAIKIDLVGEQLAVQCAKRAKRIGGEQNAVGGVKGDHGFGPVYHRCGDKGHGMPAKAPGIALLDLNQLVTIQLEAKLTHEQEGLFGRDDLDLGVTQQDFLNGCTVVGLHVVDD